MPHKVAAVKVKESIEEDVRLRSGGSRNRGNRHTIGKPGLVQIGIIRPLWRQAHGNRSPATKLPRYVCRSLDTVPGIDGLPDTESQAVEGRTCPWNGNEFSRCGGL